MLSCLVRPELYLTVTGILIENRLLTLNHLVSLKTWQRFKCTARKGRFFSLSGSSAALISHCYLSSYISLLIYCHNKTLCWLPKASFVESVVWCHKAAHHLDVNNMGLTWGRKTIRCFSWYCHLQAQRYLSYLTGACWWTEQTNFMFLSFRIQQLLQHWHKDS